jgi:hypothetical protein
VRKGGSSSVHVFDEFVFDCLKKVVLADGKIDAKEAAWLTKFVFADGKADEGEKKFLRDLKAAAKSMAPEFNELLKMAGV